MSDSCNQHPPSCPEKDRPGCRLCTLYRTDANYKAFWDGEPVPAAAPKGAPPCRHLGESVPGPERQSLGLAHAKDWRRCALGHGSPVPGIVCPCGGCRPGGCGDYAPGTDE